MGSRSSRHYVSGSESRDEGVAVTLLRRGAAATFCIDELGWLAILVA